MASQRRSRRVRRSRQLTLLSVRGPQRALASFASLRIYQWAVEREIVTRITGKGSGKDEETLLQSIQEARQH